MKHVLCSVLYGILLCALPLSLQAQTSVQQHEHPQYRALFSDVTSTHPNFDAINYAYEQNIVQGYPNGTFGPNFSINRAEFVKMIVEYKGKDIYEHPCSTQGTFFSDVPPGSWFEPYVCTAAFHGYIAGYPDGTFRPGDPISFVEVAKIISVALLHDYNDYSYNRDWFTGYVRRLDTQSAIPTSIQSFGHRMTRAEIAEILHRLAIENVSKPSWTYEDIAEKETRLSFVYPSNPAKWEADRQTVIQNLTHRGIQFSLDSNTRFDGCGPIEQYEQELWFPQFFDRLKQETLGSLSPGLNADLASIPMLEKYYNGGISEACYSSNSHTLLFILQTDYCSPSELIRYNTMTGFMQKAESDANYPNDCGYGLDNFGPRTGMTVEVRGDWGDGGCRAETYYSYNLLNNFISPTKSYFECIGEESEWVYF